MMLCYLRIAAMVLMGALTINAAEPVYLDIQKFIESEIQSGKKRIIIPSGRYRVKPKARQHLVLNNLKDVEIIADGVEMICSETTRAITISRCTNLTVRGLVIDYDPLPFTQGKIVGFSQDKKVHQIELFDGYPAAESARNFKYEIFRPDTLTLRCDDRYPENIEVIDSRHIAVHFSVPMANVEQVGDLVVIGSEYAPGGSIPHAVELEECSNTRLEDIVLFASNCFGFLENNCDRNVYYRCRIDRRPADSDIAKRAAARLRSLNADAFHSKHAVRGPAYIQCFARYMGDDAINICGDYHIITESSGNKLRALAKHNMNIKPGDSVELVSYDGKRLPDATVVSVKPDGLIKDDELNFLKKQNMDANLKNARGALNKAFIITLDRELNLLRGSVICSANRVGNGFVVKNCEFGYNRSRGILIKASNGEVVGNKLEGCKMSAILVAPEYWWLEAGSSCNLKIANNTIKACGGIPICIEAIAGNGNIAPAGAHKDIEIADNVISECYAPGILVCSTIGLHLKDNKLNLNSTRTNLPGIMRKAGLKELKPVVLINCE
ncbi:MAG: right-handed parallel beta-helix repeat-containing protein [Verrucomicrobiia bacterium]